MYLLAQVATLLFLVLGWNLMLGDGYFFPNQQATHLGFVQDSVKIILHTILYNTVKSCKREGVGQMFYYFFEMTAPEYSGWKVCHP